MLNKSFTKVLCFIVIHIQLNSNLCLTYPHFCSAFAFFLAQMIVLLNITIIFAVCYYNTRCNNKILQLNFRNNEKGIKKDGR